MKLRKLNNIRSEWQLKDLALQNVNLIVGKNAVGKSRTLEALDVLVKIILQTSNRTINKASWKIELEEDKDSLIYTVSFDQNKVLEEKIIYNNEEVLKREGNNTSIKSSKKGWEIINPPKDKIVLHVRRDTVEYPYLEKLVQWAENSYGLNFGKIAPKWITEKGYQIDLLAPLESMPNMFDRLKPNNKKTIVTSFNNLGYNLESISTHKVDDEVTLMKVKEAGVSIGIEEYALSQGMLRCLYLLIFIEYLATIETPQLVVIDDLCEGLDYERATNLGKMLFDLCLEKNIQLIATSNDSFLMDVVDLKYWNVLTREGSVVSAKNVTNSKDLFNKFAFTGLSNFDFFSSDYIKE